jgi:hypothetical protein
MANVHVLTTNPGGTLQVAFHVDTPAGTNAVGMPWSTAVLKSGYSKGTTVIATVGDGSSGSGTITQAEKDQIAAGTRVEVVTSIPWAEGMTGAQKVAAIDAALATVQIDVPNEIQRQHRDYGRTR